MSAQPVSIRLQAIAAIVRKDLHLFWPLALTVATLQFVSTTFFHEVTEFPGLRTQAVHPILHTSNPLFWIGAILPALLAAILIFVVVQADALTDRRHDWLTRPIGAMEIVAAKIAFVLAVVFAPFTIGDMIFTFAHQADPSISMLPVAIMLRNCLFGILLAWLVSNLLQAALAAVGLLALAGLVTALVMAVLLFIYYAGRAHAGLPPSGVPVIHLSIPIWDRVAAQLALQVAVMWPTLWLLLARRKIGAARLVFIAAYSVSAIIPYTRSEMTTRPAATQSAPVAKFPPTLEVLHA